MKPITVSTIVARPRQEAFEFVDVVANRAAFLDHMFVDWSFSGPARGVGARARARVSAPGSREWADFEIVEAERPERIVDQAVSSNGKRRTRGTYRFEECPEGGTKISFELAWVEVPRSERLGPPLARAFARRAYGKALRRLAKQVDRS